MSNVRCAALALACLITPGLALADVAPECDSDGDGQTDGFDASQTSEIAQQWNLANATSLAMTLSPLGVQTGLKAFKVGVGLELNQLGYMTCEERTVLGGTKTEDTNKTPLFPRLRATVALPHSYITVAGIPPVKLFGVRSGTFSIQGGGGYLLDNGLKPGARVHMTVGQIVGDIAHPFGKEPGDPGYEDEAVDDEYQFINAGADVTLN